MGKMEIKWGGISLRMEASSVSPCEGEHLLEPPSALTLSRWRLAGSLCAGALCASEWWMGGSWWDLAAVVAAWAAAAWLSVWLSRSDRGREATLAVILGAWALSAVASWLDGGLGSPFNAGCLGAVLAAALFGGREKAWEVAGLCAMAAGAMILGAQRGWLPQKELLSAPGLAVAAQCALAAVVAASVSGAMSRLAQARQSTKKGEAQAFEAAEGFEAVFERSSAPMALMTADKNPRSGGRAGLAVNEAFRVMTGMTSEDAAKPGVVSRLWVGEESRAEVLGTLDKTGILHPRRTLMTRFDDGSEIKCVASARRIQWRGRSATLWTAIDMSATARLEEKLAQANQEWSEKVQERGRVLDLARMELAKKERFSSLGEMVAGVAHEINTPIGNALLATSSLEEPLRKLGAMAKGEKVSRSELGAFGRKAAMAADLALENLARAADLIGSFKQLSTDQAGQARRKYSMERVLGDAMRLAGSAFKRKGIERELTCEPGLARVDLEGYPGAVSQIATLMAQNALEHAFAEPEGVGGRRWEVRAFLDPQHPERIRVEFEDNGPGVDEHLAGRIFDPFFTTKAASGSTGLGLSIAWSLAVDTLGGSLSLGKGRLGGALFSLSIPMVAPVREAREQSV